MENRYTKPACPYYDLCGGCQLQHLTAEAQNKWKQDLVKELFPEFPIRDLLYMEDPYRYRNKMHVSFTYGKNKKIIAGMYAENSHKIIDIEECIIEDPIGYKIIKTIKQIMKKYKMEVYNEDSGQGFLRHVLIKSAYKTGEVMVVLVVADKVFPGSSNFVKLLRKKHPEIETVILNVNNKKTSMVLGEYEKTIYGKGFIVDEMLGNKFRISAKSFYQINPGQAELLYKRALDMGNFKKTDRVIDAYSGTGTISLALAPYVEEAIGVELNKDAVRDAIKNKQYNGIKNVNFIQADAGDYMEMIASKGEKIEGLIMDPPRSGSSEKFLSSIIQLSPEKIVYISCNPETQRRDVDFLLEHKYEIKEIQPVDMFPQTQHVENIVLLEKK